MPPSPTTQADYESALQKLYDLLNNAYWLASDIGSKDAINGAAQAISDILTTLNQGALDANTEAYAGLKISINAVNAKLQTVQAQINNWVHVISVAGQVASAIDQVLT